MKTNFKNSYRYFIRHLREKHRFSIRNQHTDTEVWYIYISPLNVLAGLLALVLVLFIIVTTTVAYTPILDFIPGYPGNKSRTMLIENIMRLDSLEKEIKNMQIYNENVALIMAGKNPVTRNDMQTADSASRSKNPTVGAIIEDSILRSQMENPGSAYSINNPDAARKTLRSALELFTPVKGVRAERGSLRHPGSHHGQPAGHGYPGRDCDLLVVDAFRRLCAVHPAQQQPDVGLPAQQRSDPQGRRPCTQR